MIQGYCVTQLDDYNVKGVTSFCAVPRVGEYVSVIYKNHYGVELKVVKVTHEQIFAGPRIRVELNK